MSERLIYIMASSSLGILLLSNLIVEAWAASFTQDFDITWGADRANILNNGKLLTLSLDQSSGSGFHTKNQYLFGKIDMHIKLVSGNSAGTVTAYYLSSEGATHDEVDFEFLGNLSGQPYILHTNIFAQGQGNREQQFYLWFDPTANFHTYSVLWNPQLIVLYVDGTPIRAFRNLESKGIPFPKNQTMRVYGSIWDGEDWATQGGRIKTNWTAAPFVASFKSFKANACIWSSRKGASSCKPARSSSSKFGWLSQDLDSSTQDTIKSIQQNYMVYDYCKDTNRFPQGLPLECTLVNY
ncbi:hypothetical protein Cgig2_027028 [Carnegiea gigantea]|uniref:Xyloglucan endotransglucosylase/hydrolase n=1 Tax=Carnegiea gigantea TaxID=171969 RepID=A0A9Q1K9F3_9CARY|nr:hypothetical protein Cgig2_027028 [Carnegiea gigantea]